jgi:superfamily II DNA or RNA helicase
MVFGWSAALVKTVTAAVAAVTGTAGVAWSRAPLSKAKREARAALRPLKREVARHRALMAERHRSAGAAAQGWAAAQRRRHLERVELDALRDAGAKNVRWSALEEAGYTSLADVLEATPKALADVHGVGRLTAGRVKKAARELAVRVADEPPELPDVELTDAEAVPLAAGAVALLEARDVSGPEPAQLAARADALDRRLEPVAKEAGFGRWLVAPFRRAKRGRAMGSAESLAADARAVADSGLLEAAREGRERLAASPPLRHASPESVGRVFRDRYAECCAELEQLFTDLELGGADVSTRGRGGMTDEVAERVEAQALDASGLSVTLRRYQAFGAKYLLAQERTILGDEMGLGKTMQALAAMSHLHDVDSAKRFAVISPASLLPNWCREIETRTGLRPRLLHGDTLEGELDAWTRDGGVAVTSYDTLRRLDLGTALQNSDGAVDMLVVDEAHFVKNPEAGRTQATRRLTDRSRYVCYMSGTPMENRPEEFLQLVEAVRPDDGATLRSANLHLDAAAGSVRRFHQAVSPVYLRRNQEDVLTELPERIEMPEWVSLSAGGRAAYTAEVAASNFMGMRQAATLGDGGTDSAKLERLGELLEEHKQEGRRVIVFSYFLKVLDAVHERFGSIGIVQGKVPVAERQAMVDALGESDGHAVLLLQITAGGQGLNIQAASAVVLMEPQTKPSTEVQAIARAHRMGQTRAVVVHRLLAHDTCDATLLDILAEKQELFDIYAKKSLVKEASRQATAKSLASAVIKAEQERLAAAGAAVELAADDGKPQDGKADGSDPPSEDPPSDDQREGEREDDPERERSPAG